jgi:hypothetical protein
MSAAQSSPTWNAYPNLAKALATCRDRWSKPTVAMALAIDDAHRMSELDWAEMLDCLEIVTRPIFDPTASRARLRSVPGVLPERRRV